MPSNASSILYVRGKAFFLTSPLGKRGHVKTRAAQRSKDTAPPARKKIVHHAKIENLIAHDSGRDIAITRELLAQEFSHVLLLRANNTSSSYIEYDMLQRLTNSTP